MNNEMILKISVWLEIVMAQRNLESKFIVKIHVPVIRRNMQAVT